MVLLIPVHLITKHLFNWTKVNSKSLSCIDAIRFHPPLQHILIYLGLPPICYGCSLRANHDCIKWLGIIGHITFDCIIFIERNDFIATRNRRCRDFYFPARSTDGRWSELCFCCSLDRSFILPSYPTHCLFS